VGRGGRNMMAGRGKNMNDDEEEEEEDIYSLSVKFTQHCCWILNLPDANAGINTWRH